MKNFANFMHVFALVLVGVTTALSMTPSSLACSSCGSGGDDPLILYPSDQSRIYFGATSTNFAANIGTNSNEEALYGVRSRQRAVFAWGFRLSPKSFATLAVPEVTNHGKDDTKSGLGDPSLSYRYDLVTQDFTNPYIPQVQILAGFKPKAAKSTYNSDDQKEFLDAFGSGHHQARVGVDVWSGMTKVMYGGGYNYSYARAETYNGDTVRPGIIQSANVTVGTMIQKVKWIGGIVRTSKGQVLVNNKNVENSQALQHNVFTTASYNVAPLHELRLTWVEEGRHFNNYNTTKGRSITAAYLVTL